MKIASALLIATVALMPLHRAAAQPVTQPPEVRSPQNGAQIGAPDDTYCKGEGYCDQITARGWIPPGRSPFFVVAPRKTPGVMHVQPPISRPSRNGTFSGLVHLGKLAEGAGEEFEIFALACPSASHLTDGQELSDWPDDCDVSDPVEVYRER